MARRRFYSPPEAFDITQGSVTLEDTESRHLRDVLRLRTGDEVYVFDGVGREYRGTVSDSKRDSANVSIIEEVKPAGAESPLSLVLAVAMLKGEKLDLVVQKSVELGVREIKLFFCTNADVKPREDREANRRIERLRRIALEAVKQCGRAVIPKISEPTSFTEMLAATRQSQRILFSERSGRSFSGVEISEKQQCVTAIVGPEGGWSEEELTEAAAGDCAIVTLGTRILRAETAAITVISILQHKFGDLS